MNKIIFGDCRETLRILASKDVRVQTCVTSPPYFGLRDYGVDGQLGLEQTPDDYVTAMVEVFRAVRDVLADDGTLWLNIGDSYAMDSKWGGSTSGKHARGLHGGEDGRKLRRHTGMPDKNLIGIPWMLAFALRADGWLLRQDIIWHKPNAMPSPAKDRFTQSHEHIFLLTKSGRYYFDHEAVKELAADGSKRHRRDVWSVNTRGVKGAHFAVFPTLLAEPCILAGSRCGDIVLDPFMGSGTTAAVAVQHGRQYIGCELNPDYGSLQVERISASMLANDNNFQASHFARKAAPKRAIYQEIAPC
jgi:DNA modification methylase